MYLITKLDCTDFDSFYFVAFICRQIKHKTLEFKCQVCHRREATGSSLVTHLKSHAFHLSYVQLKAAHTRRRRRKDVEDAHKYHPRRSHYIGDRKNRRFGSSQRRHSGRELKQDLPGPVDLNRYCGQSPIQINHPIPANWSHDRNAHYLTTGDRPIYQGSYPDVGNPPGCIRLTEGCKKMTLPWLSIDGHGYWPIGSHRIQTRHENDRRETIVDNQASPRSGIENCHIPSTKWSTSGGHHNGDPTTGNKEVHAVCAHLEHRLGEKRHNFFSTEHNVQLTDPMSDRCRAIGEEQNDDHNRQNEINCAHLSQSRDFVILDEEEGRHSKGKIEDGRVANNLRDYLKNWTEKGDDDFGYPQGKATEQAVQYQTNNLEPPQGGTIYIPRGGDKNIGPHGSQLASKVSEDNKGEGPTERGSLDCDGLGGAGTGGMGRGGIGEVFYHLEDVEDLPQIEEGSLQTFRDYLGIIEKYRDSPVTDHRHSSGEIFGHSKSQQCVKSRRLSRKDGRGRVNVGEEEGLEVRKRVGGPAATRAKQKGPGVTSPWAATATVPVVSRYGRRRLVKAFIFRKK
ncbi:hypothetical protein AAG570_004855 [Ranatra chinensis]|uniref:C2H2-type domain-containing protein n=1 Tax=Ranatra chinensis TaxID=642074 RepID=A0ABD0XYQ9_9HEMI